jgi:DNA-directed RNA polymerase specialized sigma24 family protein
VLAEKFKMTTSAVRITLMRIRQQLKGCIEKKVSHA